MKTQRFFLSRDARCAVPGRCHRGMTRTRACARSRGNFFMGSALLRTGGARVAFHIPSEPVLNDTKGSAAHSLPSLPLTHGAGVLPAVTVDTYNEELRDEEGFVGDRASRRAFRAILADWRKRLTEHGDDPFGDVP